MNGDIFISSSDIYIDVKILIFKNLDIVRKSSLSQFLI